MAHLCGHMALEGKLCLPHTPQFLQALHQLYQRQGPRRFAKLWEALVQIQPAHTISLMPSCLTAPEKGNSHPVPAGASSIYRQGAIPVSCKQHAFMCSAALLQL